MNRILGFPGIGMAECLIAYFVAFYYNVIIAWSVFYLIASFNLTLPWKSCDNWWNTAKCVVGKADNVSLQNKTLTGLNGCIFTYDSINSSSIDDYIINGTASVPLYLNDTCAATAADEYFE